MAGFLYGLVLQWKLDLRSKTMLITCYAVPLLFFAVMGGIFTSVMPESRETLIPSMSVFTVTMGALIGLPPSLAEIYGSDVKNAFAANGVPLSSGLLLTNLSAFVHLLLMSCLLYIIAPAAFDAEVPAHPGIFFSGLIALTAASLGIASVIGLASKSMANTSMLSILLFVPSTMLSGIMFPGHLLPKGFVLAGKLFPATWGYAWMTESSFALGNLLPLLGIFLAAALGCAVLLKKIKTR